jgi:hypothetical protein
LIAENARYAYWAADRDAREAVPVGKSAAGMRHIRTRWQALKSSGNGGSVSVNRWIVVKQWANALCLLYIWAGALIVMSTKVSGTTFSFAGHDITDFFGWYFIVTAIYLVIVSLVYLVRLLLKSRQWIRRL